MASGFIEIIWKLYKPYRGQQIWTTAMLAEPLYAVQIGFDVKASMNLKEIHRYVDDYWKIKVN